MLYPGLPREPLRLARAGRRRRRAGRREARGAARPLPPRHGAREESGGREGGGGGGGRVLRSERFDIAALQRGRSYRSGTQGQESGEVGGTNPRVALLTGTPRRPVTERQDLLDHLWVPCVPFVVTSSQIVFSFTDIAERHIPESYMFVLMTRECLYRHFSEYSKYRRQDFILLDHLTFQRFEKNWPSTEGSWGRDRLDLSPRMSFTSSESLWLLRV
ncbi:uncharacterized protein LOC122154748 [Tyto alba]|uniref:uncharacterized protein LOC122154748 n=1 Tax=Tyto alba TaxID=56313 RepID=UPI001C675840|nr:uncharacterized protein LOC122154748 [Tyto alba]